MDKINDYIDEYLNTYFNSEQERQMHPFLKKMALHFYDKGCKKAIEELKLTLSLMSSVPPYIQNHIIDLVESNIKKE